MPLLYGSGKPLRLPGFVTGRETPGQQTRRLHDINEVLDKRAKEDEERRNLELFHRVENQGEQRFSPPSPPRSQDTSTPLPGEEPSTKLGTLGRFETYLESQLEGYEATLGITPVFGSTAYKLAESNARDFWREEQDFVPDDVVAEREVGLFLRSRELREGAERPPLAVDSKYDIKVSAVTADIAAEFVKGGVPVGERAKVGVQEDEALRFAKLVMDEFLVELEGEAKEALGTDDPQIIRELMYRRLSLQGHLSDISDEWGLTDEARQDLPQPVIDEAIQRELEENGKSIPDYTPGQQGALESLAGIAPGPLGPVLRTVAVPFDPILEGIESLWNKKFIPMLDASRGFKPTIGSLDDIHQSGQAAIADPLSSVVLRGELRAPFTMERGEEIAIKPSDVGLDVGGLAGFVGTGTEGTGQRAAVSDFLQSQLAEDILSEAISPEFLMIGIPYAGIGVKGLKGLPKLIRITANVIGGGDLGFARGFPLLRPSSIPAVFRGITSVAKSPLALRSLPAAVRNNRFFQVGHENIQAARASRIGRGLPHDEYLQVIGATDDVKFKRVVDDLSNRRPSKPEDLPLRQAFDRDLLNKRSMEEIIEHGPSPRAEAPVPRAPGESTDEVSAFWRGEDGPDRRFLSQREAAAEQRVFDALDRVEIVGGHRGIRHEELMRTVRNTDLVDADLLRFALEDELIGLLQARRVITATRGTTLKKMTKNQLFDIMDDAGIYNIDRKAGVGKIRSDLQEVANKVKTLRETLASRSFENLSPSDMAALYARGGELGGQGPTQLVTPRVAQQFEGHRLGGIDPRLSAADRLAHKDKYLARLERLAAEAPATPAGDVQRVSAATDAASYRYDWEARFERPLTAVQEEAAGNLTLLTAQHRGSPEARLKKLSLERAKEIPDGVDDFLFQFRDVLSANDLAASRRRLITMMLDVEDGAKIVDAGRQVETLLRIAKVGKVAKNKAFSALRILTEEGVSPTPQQIEDLHKILEPVLGVGTTRALMNARTWGVGGKGGELVLNSLGLPRALMASSDLSALARQGSMLGARYLKEWAQMAGRAARSFFSPGYADSVRDSIVHGGAMRLNDGTIVNMYDLQRATGGFIASDAGQLGLMFREEGFMTSWASKWGWHLPRDAAGNVTWNPRAWEKQWFPIPLAQSERSYVMPLDRLRRDFFDNTVRNLVKRGAGGGTPVRLEHIEQLSLFINNATGRGSLGKFKNWGPILNALFFAPRLVVSRFAITADLIRHTAKGGPMRRVVWETLVADTATASGALFLIDTSLKEAGLEGGVNFLKPIEKGDDDVWRVRSDWMKINVGETYIDFMASMGPTQRLMFGLGVAAYQGDPEMAVEIAERFLKSKEAPVPSGITEVVTGTDYAGGKVELSLEDLLGDLVLSRTLPLSWQSPFEAVAAARGEIDIDTGPAILDVLSDYKLDKDEIVAASASLSAEMIGGGVVSYYQPGDKLREKDNENLQVLIDRGEMPLEPGQEASDLNDRGDLNTIQAGIMYDARGPEEKALEEKVEEQARWRDSEWIKDKEDEEDFHRDIRIDGFYTHPETGKKEQLWKWPQDELDLMLRNHQIDGGDWNLRTIANITAEINVQRALFGHEEEDIEDIENPVDKALAEYWLIEPQMLPSGEYDYDAFKAERKVKQDEIGELVGDPKKVAEYFESFRDKDTQTQKDHRVAKEQRNTLLDDTPKYMGGISETTVNNLESEIKDYLLSVGSRWSVSRYIQWLYYQGEQYQTKEMAVTYWANVPGGEDLVINPQRTQMVLDNDDLVLFYPGLFRGLTDEGKQRFVNRYDIKPLSKGLQEDFIDTGEISRPGEGTGTQLFQSQALFERPGG